MSTLPAARIFLGLNAAFSVISGLALLFVSSSIAQMMFTDPGDWKATILLGLGIGLLVFALDLVMLATNPYVSKSEVMLIVIADIGWIAVSAVLILFFGDLFTSNGILAISVVATFVALFAIGQFVGAQKIVPPVPHVDFRREGGGLVATVKRKVNAPVETVWDVMNDHPGYADVASNIAKVEVLSGDGVGMKRRCYGPKGENWEETCDRFEDGRAYGFRIHTEAQDYPYPFADLRGLWSVEPSGSGSEFSIEIAVKPKGNIILRSLFAPTAIWKFKPILVDLADAWAARMESKSKSNRVARGRSGK